MRSMHKRERTLRLIGWDEIKRLFDHVGEVANADTFEQAIKKVSDGIKKLAEWYTKVKEQADRCVWTGYDSKAAARDAILYQTDAKKSDEKDH